MLLKMIGRAEKRFMFYGLWFMVYGLGFRGLGFRFGWFREHFLLIKHILMEDFLPSIRATHIYAYW